MHDGKAVNVLGLSNFTNSSSLEGRDSTETCCPLAAIWVSASLEGVRNSYTLGEKGTLQLTVIVPVLIPLDSEDLGALTDRNKFRRANESNKDFLP